VQSEENFRVAVQQRGLLERLTAQLRSPDVTVQLNVLTVMGKVGVGFLVLYFYVFGFMFS